MFLDCMENVISFYEYFENIDFDFWEDLNLEDLGSEFLDDEEVLL